MAHQTTLIFSKSPSQGFTLGPPPPPTKKRKKEKKESDGVQTLSIHQIHLKRTKKTLGYDGDKLEELAQKIVEWYTNEHPQPSHYQSVSGVSPSFKLGNFYFIAFRRRPPPQTSRLATWLQSIGATEELTTVKVSFLFFLHRKTPQEEMFALTTGQGFQVVQKFSNYAFSPKVAKRLMHPTRIASDRKPIVGDVILVHEILKKEAVIMTSDTVDNYFSRLTFSPREDSSLFNLKCFRTNKDEPLKRGVKVEFGLSLIRLTKQIAMEEYSELLCHLSKVSHGKETFCYPESKKILERDSEGFEFMQFFKPAFGREKELDLALQTLVLKKEKLGLFDFCHKKRKEYLLYGSDYKICYEKESLDCIEPTSALYMIGKLEEFEGLKKLGEKEKRKKLSEVTVSFVSQGRKDSAPLIDYLEGEVLLDSGERFWRLHTIWYEVNEDYMALVQQDFKQMLRHTLIKRKEEGFLPLKWPSPKERAEKKAALKEAGGQRYSTEREYNGRYLNEAAYLTIDGVNPPRLHSIELADILYFKEEKVYFYHVKEGFSQKTRDVCAQIREASKLIWHEHGRGLSKQFEDILRSLYKVIKGYQKNEDPYRQEIYKKLEQIASTEQGFIQLFHGKDIVFVCALVDDAEKPRFIIEESQQRPRISASGIEKSNQKFKGYSEEILKGVIKDGYVNEQKRLSSRFNTSTPETFNPQTVATEKGDLLKVDNQKRSLHQNLKSTHRSVFESSIAKLELLTLYKEFRASRFELRICQIDRTDYESFPEEDQVFTLSDDEPLLSLENDLSPYADQLLPEFDDLEVTPDDFSLDESDEDFEIDVAKLFESIEPVGIHNSGNDCFINSVLQLIFHTSLFKLFIDKKYLLIEDKCGNYDFEKSENREALILKERQKREHFYKTFKNFLFSYNKTTSSKACDSPKRLRKAIAELNHSNTEELKTGQHDVSHLFNILRGCYNTTAFCPKVSILKIPDREKEKSVSDGLDLSQYSQLDESGSWKVKTDTPFFLELPIPEGAKELCLETCLNAYLNENESDECRYISQGECYASQTKTKSKFESAPQEGLLISYKRFRSDGIKISSPIEVKSFELNIGSKNYFLKGFIVHLGDSTKKGHYVTYCFCSKKDQWLMFNDEDVKSQKIEEIQETVKNAYILFFDPKS